MEGREEGRMEREGWREGLTERRTGGGMDGTVKGLTGRYVEI